MVKQEKNLPLEVPRTSCLYISITKIAATSEKPVFLTSSRNLSKEYEIIF